MTTLAVEALDTTLAVATPTPTQLVAALDPPLVLQVAPAGATLAVTAPQAGVLTAPAEQGPAGVAGKDGRDGGNLTYAYPFETAAAVWSIAHGLGRYPSVTAVDTAGDVFVGDLTYPDANTVVITVSVPIAGTAYLN